MKIFLLLLLGMSVALKAQTESDASLWLPEEIRVVEDTDGFTNLRAAASMNAKVIGKLPAGSAVAIDPNPNGKWARLMQEGFYEKDAFISTSRLRTLDGWLHVKTKGVGDAKSATVKRDGLEARVTSAKFKAAEHKITRKDNAVVVDGLEPWGDIGGVPRESLKLEVTVNGKPLKLPDDASRNLYEPDLDSLTLLTPKSAMKQALILMQNSDGGGSYCVVWAFKDGAYLGRTVFGTD